MSAVHDDAADGRTVATDEFGGRVHDDVGTVAKGLGQVRGGQRAVDHKRNLVLVRDARHTFEVEDVALGIAERLREERLGVGPDGRTPRLQVVGIVDEGHVDAQLGQCVVEEVVRSAIEGRRRDDMTAVLGQVEQRDGLSGLAAGDGECRDPTLEGGDALLEDGLRRVHDARVDVPQFLEPEERRRVRCVPKGVAGGLVDRHRAGTGGRIGHRTGVDLASFETPVGHGVASLRRSGVGGRRRTPEGRVLQTRPS